jgi:hypothetical protein
LPRRRMCAFVWDAGPSLRMPSLALSTASPIGNLSECLLAVVVAAGDVVAMSAMLDDDLDTRGSRSLSAVWVQGMRRLIGAAPNRAPGRVAGGRTWALVRRAPSVCRRGSITRELRVGVSADRVATMSTHASTGRCSRRAGACAASATSSRAPLGRDSRGVRNPPHQQLANLQTSRFIRRWPLGLALAMRRMLCGTISF